MGTRRAEDQGRITQGNFSFQKIPRGHRWAEDIGDCEQRQGRVRNQEAVFPEALSGKIFNPTNPLGHPTPKCVEEHTSYQG